MDLEILHHAIERFNRDGVSFKLDDIASDMKISKKTIYKHYSSKEDIISEIIESLFKDIKSKEHEIFSDNTLSSVEKLMAILSVYPDYEAFNYKHIPELKEAYPNLYQKLEKHLENNWDETFILLDACIEQGEVHPISHDIFQVIFLGLYKQLLLTEDNSPEKRMKCCIETIFHGLKK